MNHTERYLVCQSCGHQWNVPVADDITSTCENCRSQQIEEYDTPAAQDDASAEVTERGRS